ncbi:MAG: glucokinase [Candidatus Obscuribacterales bacterium]|nr:glucokinase [Candidatus Obscuribacterales bacterium]
MILAGDIGGTKTSLAFFSSVNGELSQVAEETYSSQKYKELEELLKVFLAAHPEKKARYACLSIAGPVINGTCKATNLPWNVDARQIGRNLDFDSLWLINDLEANAHGMTHLLPESYAVLYEGKPGMRGNACVVSAGTGLGEAGMFWNGDGYIPFACEGGHTDFAPRNDEQIELLKYIRRDHQHVSYERLLSGMGLYNIYSFLRDTNRYEEPEWLAHALASVDDQAAAISQYAIENQSEICDKALDMFVEIYGAEAGNAALKFMAYGGVFLGGGIAPKILDKLRGPAFTEAFLSKGRMRPLMEYMPVKVILQARAALLGAARCAMLKSGQLHATAISS